MVKNTLTSIVTATAVAIVVSVLALAGFNTPQPVVMDQSKSDGLTLAGLETVRLTLGGGVDVIANNRDGGLVFKGGLATTSAATTTVIPSSNIVGFNTILYKPLRPNVTLQLPASTTFPQSFLPRAGDRTRILFFNATTTTTGSQNNVGFAGGTGTLVKVASSTPAGTASTTGQNAMEITILRKPNTDLLFLLEPYK
jgi:hypothetical protein